MAGVIGPLARLEHRVGRGWRLLGGSLAAWRGEARVLKNFAALLGADVLSKLLTLLTVAYLARTIDHEAFGRIAFAESILLTALLVSDFGLEWYGVRELARAPDTVRERVAVISGLRCLLFLGVGVAVALAPLIFRAPADARALTWLFGLSLLPNAVLLEWVFCGFEQMGIVAVSRLLRSGVYSLLVLTFVRDSRAALGIPLTYLVATSFGAAILLTMYVRRFGWPRIRWQPRAWRRLLRQSVPLAFNVLLLRGFYSLSMLVLGFYLSEREVGLFSAAYRPVLVLIPLGGYLMTAVFPPLARAGRASPLELQRHARALITIVLVCAAPILIEGSMHAEEVMRTLFGPSYATGGRVFRLLASSVLVMWMSMTGATLLMATDRTLRFTVGVVLGLCTATTLLVALVPTYGIEGASWAVIGGQLAGLAFFWLALPSALRAVPWMALAAVFMASAAMVGAMLPLQSSSLVLSSLSGLVVYVIALLVCLAIRAGTHEFWGSRMRAALD